MVILQQNSEPSKILKVLHFENANIRRARINKVL